MENNKDGLFVIREIDYKGRTILKCGNTLNNKINFLEKIGNRILEINDECLLKQLQNFYIDRKNKNIVY